MWSRILIFLAVALRKESVDRNIWSHTAPYLDNNVALRKESVDRNNAMQVVIVVMHAVALRKESVDRNQAPEAIRADQDVALRKESVDRNIGVVQIMLNDRSRSPQGERG